ncbi:putative epidermal cell surface receptor isoform X1 [Onthophagus taurus]|uniref:putative epidermal cell surface receptor isoform X1 n=1 Tax=Onthophagus taurus TaxID=166361 RepID=UPI0039BE89C2
MRNNILVFCLYTLVFMSCREVFGNFNAANDCEDTECGSNNKNSDEPIYEVITVIPKPVELPESLSMVSEEDAHVFEPTVVSTIAEEPKGRSLNFTLDEHSHNNDLTKNNNTKVETNNKKKVIDLSDVDMDNDYDTVLDGDNVDDDTKGLKMNQGSKRVCEKGGLTYENGEKLEVGCDSICTCTNGKMDCIDRCSTPYFKKGKKIEDPLCVEQPAPDDNCCSMLSCSDTATEAIEFCSYNNKTYNRGETVRNDCEKVCHCAMGGKITCKDSCESPKKISKKCFLVPDPDNTCCKKVLCDVNHTKGKIISAKFINKTTIKVDFDTDSDEMRPLIDLSNDKINWKTFTLLPGDYLHGIEDKVNFIRIENEDDIMDIEGTTKSAPLTQNNCTFNGKNYKIGQEFNDGCKSICVCKTTGVKCLKLECPTYFGTDIIDPNCIEWETVPADFKPIPPKCCPDQLKCKYNGSCMYDGRTYDNHQEIPTNLTGCEKRCYCEMGEVECQNVCAPVPPTPPRNLPCPPSHATLKHRPGDDCCLEWMCQKLDLPPEKTTTSTEKSVKSKKPLDTKDTTDSFDPAFDPFPTHKPPSKTQGPLQIYENGVQPLKPNISLDENIYYVNGKNKTGKYKPGKEQKETSSNQRLNPKDHKPPPNKETNSSNKEEENIDENYIPQYPVNNYNKMNQPPPNTVHIHAQHGTPDEFLQLIHQNPEITNYPPGTVLEVHNVQNPLNKQYVNPNTIHDNPFYLLNNHQQGAQNNIPIEQGQPNSIPIEHFLQQINSHKQFQKFAQNYPPQNGPLYVPQPNIFSGQPQRNASSSPGLSFSPTFPQIPAFPPQQHQEILIQHLEAIDPHTVKLSIEIPTIFVGFLGTVEVRYTNTRSKNVNEWKSETFAPPNDILATSQLEFELSELIPDQSYQIKVSVTFNDVHNVLTSKIYQIKTPKLLPSMIPIEPDLNVSEVNSTWAVVSWRKFADNELQFIDGVQLRYKVTDGKIFDATTLIHRAVTSYTLENLRPETTYEVGIYFIPFTNQKTELRSDHMISFTTGSEMDAYGFNVSLEILQVKPTSVEISWKGVPYPEDKYVNIYRAIYQSDSGKGDYSTFKMAKRDSPSKTVIMDLKPGTRYRLWLEVYLTSGRIKTSNVQDFITKPGSAPTLGASSIDKLSGNLSEERGDYYGSLVFVAILATIAILSTLVLLLILIRRHSTNKASITPPPRVTQAAYDNPTYKVEIQQETMGL